MVSLVWILGIAAVVHGEPSFLETETNITVMAGQTAELPCVFDNLGRYKVVWTDKWSTLLTYMSWCIIDDPRVEVSSNGNNEWSLVIHDTHLQDSGEYSCQVNTDPVKIHTVHLNVMEYTPGI